MKMYLMAAILSACFANSVAVGQTAQIAESDWPQILGVNRNGVHSASATIGWSGQPKVDWEVEVGDGFSGPVISDGSLILFHRPRGARGSLVVEKFKVVDGSTIWKTNLKSDYEGKMDRDTGPKATPAIVDGFIYCHGPDGELACVDFESGDVKWEINARKMFNGPTGYFGCGSSPLVVDGKVLLNVGGKLSRSSASEPGAGASVVAFDAKTGEVVWSAVNDTASYSSPISVEYNGKPLAIFLTRTRFVGIDVATGEVQFSNPFGVRGPTAVGAMPVAFGSKIFATASYNVGSTVIDLASLSSKGGELKPEWSNKETFASHYGTPVFHEGYFYGTSGREDMRNGTFRCIDAATGDIVWNQRSFPVAHTLKIGSQLLALDHKGKLSLLEAYPEKFSLQASATVFKGETRAIPAYSNGRLYFRSNARKSVGKLVAIKIAQ